jgi:glycosyltransferase involved in cell wall biosynthesis
MNSPPPFFSVVTEVFNRKNSIEKTILSIHNQSIKDYEYIIVDFDSTDGTSELIDLLLQSLGNEKIRYIKLPFEPHEIKRWNVPLKFANGQYVAVVEGDDWFEEMHLEKSKEALLDPEIGLYIARKKAFTPLYSGKIDSKFMLKELRMLNFCPPPSEVIFLRNFSGRSYYYDDINYVYAAEFSLYEKILSCGLDVYFEYEGLSNYVGRSPSYRQHSFKHIQDQIYFANKNYCFLSGAEIDTVNKRITLDIAKIFALQLKQLRFELKLLKEFVYWNAQQKNIKIIFYFLLVLLGLL